MYIYLVEGENRKNQYFLQRVHIEVIADTEKEAIQKAKKLCKREYYSVINVSQLKK